MLRRWTTRTDRIQSGTRQEQEQSARGHADFTINAGRSRRASSSRRRLRRRDGCRGRGSERLPQRRPVHHRYHRRRRPLSAPRRISSVRQTRRAPRATIPRAYEKTAAAVAATASVATWTAAVTRSPVDGARIVSCRSAGPSRA